MKRILLFVLLCPILLFVLTNCGVKMIDTDRIEASPHFQDGVFKNVEEIPPTEGDQGALSLMWEIYVKSERPKKPIPSVKTDLLSLDKNEEILIWFGHSSFLLQTRGARFLVDPVLSEHASPLPFGNKPFAGTRIYKAADIPQIDYLIITHDHYDHLSKKTVRAIRDRVGKVICPIGVGAYLVSWGYSKDQIIEMDWNEDYRSETGFNIYCLTARHYSGPRGMGRNRTLWASFLIETPERKIYIGGDSGYGEHFKQISEQFGVIDLAFLDSGQYDRRWRFIHMNPEDMLLAAAELNTKYVMPYHHSKFKQSAHAWNDPLIQLTSLHDNPEMILMTPMIGEKVPLWDKSYEYKVWWLEDNR